MTSLVAKWTGTGLEAEYRDGRLALVVWRPRHWLTGVFPWLCWQAHWWSRLLDRGEWSLYLGPASIHKRKCTGVSARWCAVHGGCRCSLESDDMDSPGCPLHAHDSDHAEN